MLKMLIIIVKIISLNTVVLIIHLLGGIILNKTAV